MRYRVYLQATASTTVEVEAPDRDAAVIAAQESGLPTLCNQCGGAVELSDQWEPPAIMTPGEYATEVREPKAAGISFAPDLPPWSAASPPAAGAPAGAMYLDSGSLLSKWGFNDGDMPDGLYTYAESTEKRLGSALCRRWHEILEALVLRYLVPALGQPVTLEVVSTCHNPVRLLSVDGADAVEGLLPPVVVRVPYSEVIAVARHFLRAPER